jgi:hypothetical protein
LISKSFFKPSQQVVQPCQEFGVFSELSRSADNYVLETWAQLARVGVDGAPPYFVTADPVSQPLSLLREFDRQSTLCKGTQKETASLTFLLVPVISDLQARQAEEASRLLLTRPLPGQLSQPRLLIPVGRGSLIRLSPPAFGAHLGVLWEGQEEGPSEPNTLSNAVLEDPADYRIRLPNGTVRVLIIKF